MPTKLVAAFRATLEEVIEADLLLEVVDINHENAIEQSDTVTEILDDLDALDKPRVTALNKIDLLEDPEDIDLSLYPNAVAISALHNQGLDTLLAKIAQVLAENMETIDIVLPYSKGELVELFHRRGYVDRESHEMDGVHMQGRVPRALHGYYAPFAVE